MVFIRLSVSTYCEVTSCEDVLRCITVPILPSWSRAVSSLSAGTDKVMVPKPNPSPGALEDPPVLESGTESAGAPGATAPDLASGAQLTRVPPAAGAPPPTAALVLDEPPALHPESNRAVSVPAAIIFPVGKCGRVGSACRSWKRYLLRGNVIFMADLRRTIAVRAVFPLERLTVPFVPSQAVSIRSRGRRGGSGPATAP